MNFYITNSNNRKILIKNELSYDKIKEKLHDNEIYEINEDLFNMLSKDIEYIYDRNINNFKQYIIDIDINYKEKQKQKFIKKNIKNYNNIETEMELDKSNIDLELLMTTFLKKKLDIFFLVKTVDIDLPGPDSDDRGYCSINIYIRTENKIREIEISIPLIRYDNGHDNYIEVSDEYTLFFENENGIMIEIDNEDDKYFNDGESVENIIYYELYNFIKKLV